MQEYSLTFPERRANSTGTSFHGGAESKSPSKKAPFARDWLAPALRTNP